MAEPLGVNSNYYYPELAAEWPKIYNLKAESYTENGETIYTGDFYQEVKDHPEELTYFLDFIDSNASESVISKVSRDFDLDCSIIFGDVDIIKDKSLGQLIISVKGENEDIKKAKKHLDQVNVKWELIEIWKQ